MHEIFNCSWNRQNIWKHIFYVFAYLSCVYWLKLSTPRVSQFSKATFKHYFSWRWSIFHTPIFHAYNFVAISLNWLCKNAQLPEEVKALSMHRVCISIHRSFAKQAVRSLCSLSQTPSSVGREWTIWRQ